MAKKPKSAATKTPLLERTTSRGVVDLKFPGIEVSFPATNRSVMVVICTGFITLALILPLCCYLMFSARPESLEAITNIFDGKTNEPVSVPVQTNNGIEMIEVCPPCPICEECPECVCTPRECSAIAPVAPPPAP